MIKIRKLKLYRDLLLFLPVITGLTGCVTNEYKTIDIDLTQADIIYEQANVYDVIDIKNRHYAELYEITAQIPDEFREWTVEELGETIVAAGLFWEEWWELNGRFSYEHITQYDWREIPSISGRSYQRLLPTSGFNNLNDIRNYLLHYYTETWLNAELSGEIDFIEIVPFVEYRNILYTHIFRTSLPRPNWNTAVHTLIENDGNYAVVETGVLTGFWDRKMDDEFFWEAQHRFTFVNGKIYSNEIIVPLLEQPITWTIEELGETIVAAGMFWEEWWGVEIVNVMEMESIRFIVDPEAYVPAHFPRNLYAKLLPASGFRYLNDIRNYLQQFYTERWIDKYLASFPFVEYDHILYMAIVRAGLSRPGWWTASHVLIEQEGNVAVVETTLYHGSWHRLQFGGYAYPFKMTHHFTLVDGRIDSTSGRGWILPSY